MSLTREDLIKKRDQLKSQQDQLIANVNAIMGGIQLVETLLTELDESGPCPISPAKTEKADKKPKS